MRRKCNQILVTGGLFGTALLGVSIALLAPRPNGAGEGVAGPLPQVMIVERAAIPVSPAPELMAQWAARATARPLFSPTRRPASPPDEPAGKQSDPPRLSGVATWSGGGYAIFQPDKARPVVVGEGATLGEWVVRTIAAGSVTVSRGDERQVLRPSFAEAPTASTPAPRKIEARARDQWGRHIRPPDYLQRRAHEG